MPLLFRNGRIIHKGALAVPIYVFQLLEILPGLHDLIFADHRACVRLQELRLFARIAQQTALQHLSFSIEHESVANGPPVTGPRGLQLLQSSGWFAMQWVNLAAPWAIFTSSSNHHWTPSPISSCAITHTSISRCSARLHLSTHVQVHDIQPK